MNIDISAKYTVKVEHRSFVCGYNAVRRSTAVNRGKICLVQKISMDFFIHVCTSKNAISILPTLRAVHPCV